MTYRSSGSRRIWGALQAYTESKKEEWGFEIGLPESLRLLEGVRQELEEMGTEGLLNSCGISGRRDNSSDDDDLW